MLATPGWFDGFDRPDAGSLGGVWRDVKDDSPDSYSRLGIIGGSVGCPDPYDRPGVAAEFAGIGDGAHTVGPGEYAPGIGAAYVDTPWTDVEATVLYLGDTTVDHRIEGAPGVHFTPGTTSMCLGAWPSRILFGQVEIGVIFVGTLGDPAEAFAVLAYSVFDFGVTPRTLTLRTVDGQATVLLDGDVLPLTENGTGNPLGNTVTVPAELAASTKHGFCVDVHLDPDGQHRVIDWVRIKAVDS